MIPSTASHTTTVHSHRESADKLLPSIFRKLLVGRKYQYASFGCEFGDADIGDLQDGGPEVFEFIQHCLGLLGFGVAMCHEISVLVLVPGLLSANGPIRG